MQRVQRTGAGLLPTSPPSGTDQPENEPDEDDCCRDLYPEEAPKLPQDDFGLGAPIARKGVADPFMSENPP